MLQLMLKAALLLCLVAPSLVCASENKVAVERDGRTFSIQMDVPIAADLPAAVAVLSQLAEYHQLHHSIKASRVTYSMPGYKPRLRTEVHSCVWFFCKDMAWIGDVSIVKYGHWRARTIKKKKTSFSTGLTEWGVRQHEEHVSFFFESTFKVGFWIPPVIGEWLIKSKLEKETVELAENIAVLAKNYGDRKK